MATKFAPKSGVPKIGLSFLGKSSDIRIEKFLFSVFFGSSVRFSPEPITLLEKIPRWAYYPSRLYLKHFSNLLCNNLQKKDF
uniref:Uncharacterized protein n=1 Tax=Meloidogyne enterolobii TaxID=390850 RepID=A0A6V7U5U1_MELEN|nr:unnamed protein product [Meloidogyne enterolobii]